MDTSTLLVAGQLTEVQDNLYGPGSGVKFFQVIDPDGITVTFAQA